MKNFVNPKKIKGQDKLDRIKDLMGKMNTLNESTSLSEVENVKKGANGVIYGIIRENHSYFIKTTEKTSGTLIAEDFNYIGGLQNKNLERYGSYAEALKQLNLKFDMINESFGVKGNTNLFESDAVEVKEANASGLVVKEEQKEVIEDQKSVIKVDVPKTEAPVEDEVEDEVSMEEDPFGDMGGEETEEVDVDVEEEGDEDDTTKKIQKLTGKIGQLLRDKEEPDAELDKYVINSIISAIDWDEMSDEDVEDIIAKIEGEEEEDAEGSEEIDIDMDAEEGGEEVSMDVEAEAGEELAEGEEKDKEEHEKMDKDEDKEDEEELSHEDLEEKLKHHEDAIKNIKKEIADLHKDEKEDEKDKEEEEKEKVDEVEEKVDEGNKFSGERQKAIDAGEDEFEVDGKKYDVTGDKEEKNESRKFSKKQLMENFLKKNIHNSLTKILNEQLEEGVTDLDLESGNDVRVVEQNMDIVDAIATGQNYLQASGDLDRDGDQIPNRLDLDNNMDGELDFETFDDGDDFIEIDFESLMSDAPVKEPGIKEPTTRPGRKKPRWKKIPRPQVNPKPKAKDRRRINLGRNGMYR